MAEAQGPRDDIIVMTKVGMWDQRKGLSSANIEAAAEDLSSADSRPDTSMCLALHISTTRISRSRNFLEAFSRLIQAGKVRTIGASKHKAESELSQALDTAASKQLPRYEVLQPEYNLYNRQEFEGGLHKCCLSKRSRCRVLLRTRERLPHRQVSLGRRSERQSRGGRVKKYLNARGLRILRALDEVSSDLSATPAQVALAWLIARPGITAPIASATSIPQLDDTLGAALSGAFTRGNRGT